jgi:hypothetical protein
MMMMIMLNYGLYIRYIHPFIKENEGIIVILVILGEESIYNRKRIGFYFFIL